MINRDDMMELTRRMTVKRASVTRIAGAYMDAEGFVDGTFNVNYLNLSARDKEKNLAIAKAIPYAKTNENLKEYHFSKENQGKGSMWQLLMGLRSCGLKNDAVMDIFYELIGEKYQSDHDYGIFMFHGRYDIPMKTTDKRELWDSEEVYEYMICAICPVTGDYEPGKPECGFLFPAFSDRAADLSAVDVFEQKPNQPHKELLQILGCC